MRNQFRDRVTDTLLSPTNPVAAWFRRDAIEALLGAHMTGRREHGKRLWALFILYTVAARQTRTAPLPLKQAAFHV